MLLLERSVHVRPQDRQRLLEGWLIACPLFGQSSLIEMLLIPMRLQLVA